MTAWEESARQWPHYSQPTFWHFPEGHPLKATLKTRSDECSPAVVCQIWCLPTTHRGPVPIFFQLCIQWHCIGRKKSHHHGRNWIIKMQSPQTAAFSHWRSSKHLPAHQWALLWSEKTKQNKTKEFEEQWQTVVESILLLYLTVA